MRRELRRVASRLKFIRNEKRRFLGRRFSQPVSLESVRDRFLAPEREGFKFVSTVEVYFLLLSLVAILLCHMRALALADLALFGVVTSESH
jgi:hypothetical protein